MWKVFAAVVLVIAVGLVGRIAFPPPSAQAPVNSPSAQLTPLAHGEFPATPSAIVWLEPLQQWWISSALPQDKLANQNSMLYRFDAQLSTSDSVPLPASGNVSDFSIIDQQLAALDGQGRFLLFGDYATSRLAHRRKLLRDGLSHQLAAFAWLAESQQLIACEQQGKRLCYLFDRELQLQKTLELPPLSNGDSSYSIDSLAVHRGTLLGLSRSHQLLIEISSLANPALRPHLLPLDNDERALSLTTQDQQLVLLTVNNRQTDGVKLWTIDR